MVNKKLGKLILIYIETMCGFAGIFNSHQTITNEYLHSIAGRVCFRGPDNTSTRVLDPAMQDSQYGSSGLFFNRLAIIDLNERSNQPYERYNCLLLFNGEIYNYKSIKWELEQKKILFETTSDTEVLFYALKTWGKNAIERLNGMFAFCWLNRNTGEFILARDRLGIKPLYYAQDRNILSFGSELHSVIRLLNTDCDISPEAVRMFLWMQYIPTPFTIIKGIYKLPPGHYLQGSVHNLDNSTTIEPIPYWNAYVEYNQPSLSNPEDLEMKLTQSLERQFEADVPLGLFLSSGVDSSLLAALVNKYFASNKTFSFFTVAFSEDTQYDESRDAKEYINAFQNNNLQCHKLTVDSSYIENHLDKFYTFFDEPFADSASLLNWVISRKAREYATVAISGDGADELFWGYPRYNKWERLRSFQVKGISSIARQLTRLLPPSSLKYNSLYALEANPVEHHFETFLSSGLRFLIEESVTKNRLWAMRDVDLVAGRKDLPAVLDIKTYLADAMLYKVDRSSMAASLEVRVPYLDNEVVDFALHLPFEYKSNKQFRNKAILKDLLLRLAPQYDVNKPKKGFNFPVENWLRDTWKDGVLEGITPDALNDLGLEAGPYIKIIDNFYNKKTGHYTDVWTLYNLILWQKNFKKVLSSTHHESISYGNDRR